DIPPPPISPLFPYTTLFRSERRLVRRDERLRAGARDERDAVVLPPERLVRGVRDDEVDLLRVELLPRVVDHLGVGPGLEREPDRSEEHTSELQSRSDLVCRL